VLADAVQKLANFHGATPDTQNYLHYVGGLPKSEEQIEIRWVKARLSAYAVPLSNNPGA
jgi:hypothetical protein